MNELKKIHVLSAPQQEGKVRNTQKKGTQKLGKALNQLLEDQVAKNLFLSRLFTSDISPIIFSKKRCELNSIFNFKD